MTEIIDFYGGDEMAGIQERSALWKSANSRGNPDPVAFSFCEINPGLGLFGYAAQLAGGIPHGSADVTDIARESYQAWFGSGSLEEPYTPVQVVLANLPYSVFLDREAPDPEVRDIVEKTAKIAKKSKLVIFRVDWTVGERLGLDPDDYVQLISAFLPKFSVESIRIRNCDFIPMDGHELFIIATKSWGESHPISELGESTILTENEPVSPYFPEAERFDGHYLSEPRTMVYSAAGFRPLTPQEIGNLLGVHKDFPLPMNQDHAYQLLGASVAVPAAKYVISKAVSAAKIH